MIRKFVPVKDSVINFCCVLNFMGMDVPNSVVKYCLASYIHDFDIENTANFMMKEWNNRVTE